MKSMILFWRNFISMRVLKVSNRFLLSDVAGKMIGVFKDIFLLNIFLKITDGKHC